MLKQWQIEMEIMNMQMMMTILILIMKDIKVNGSAFKKANGSTKCPLAIFLTTKLTFNHT
ncbi:hypothetical protein X953_01555 [Virgibacillus sp. SK37]|nr:hypothetical protein X953_01555 [Virgibacillus sp. SK37]